MQPPRSTADQQRPPQVPHHQRFPEGSDQGRAQQIGPVEQLARTQRTSSQEALELQQVAYLLQAA
jgi:hypothetical protein